jgi:hypothetical protein
MSVLRGRPPLCGERRDEQITALFTKHEKDMVIKAALARGIAPGLLVRNAALNIALSRESAA